MNHIARDIAEPENAVRPPQRPFSKDEAAGESLDLRARRDERVEIRMQPADAADGRHELAS